MDPIYVSELLYQDLGNHGFAPKTDTRLWHAEAGISVMVHADHIEVRWDIAGIARFGWPETENDVHIIASMIATLVAELLGWVEQS